MDGVSMWRVFKDLDISLMTERLIAAAAVCSNGDKNICSGVSPFTDSNGMPLGFGGLSTAMLKVELDGTTPRIYKLIKIATTQKKNQHHHSNHLKASWESTHEKVYAPPSTRAYSKDCSQGCLWEVFSDPQDREALPLTTYYLLPTTYYLLMTDDYLLLATYY